MVYWDSSVGIEDLMGKLITKIDRESDEQLIFHTTDGYTYKMYHEQDCCESVTIEDIIGDLDDLIGTPVTMAECVHQDGDKEKHKDEDYWSDDSSTWTFYKLATYKGYVTIRWFGTSNGYYSESAQFAVMKDKAPWEERIDEYGEY